MCGQAVSQCHSHILEMIYERQLIIPVDVDEVEGELDWVSLEYPEREL